MPSTVLTLHQTLSPKPETPNLQTTNIGVLMVRIGFWGPLYYNYNKEPPKNSIANYQGSYIKLPSGGALGAKIPNTLPSERSRRSPHGAGLLGNVPPQVCGLGQEFWV